MQFSINRPKRRSSAAVFVVVLALASLAVAGSSSAAPSQEECSPIYGCEPTTTTTLAPSVLPECVVSTSVATPGTTVGLTIRNVPTGLEIDLLFNGTVVDSAVAGGSPVVGRSSTATAPRPKAARAGAAATGATPGFSDVDLSFVVPDLAPGAYTLEAVGPAFYCECLPGTGFAVLAAQLTPTTLSSGGTGGTGGGSLVRTGTYIGLLLAIALALLVAGRTLQERAKRTRLEAGLAPRGRHGVDPGGRRSAR